ncbi:MAG: DUF4114 domain-containing protein [Verrucomicrobia bacterium]|nr:DUF4114 domain-containing protein [Verrucomicrobiota bacterium]
MRPPISGRRLLLSSLFGTWTALAADSGINSPVQSAARPFGLEIAGPVKLAGSDAAASTFQTEALPGLSALVQTRLSEQGPINDSTLLLDPDKLILSTAADVRVYFVGEGAGYHNSLGFNTAGGGVTSGNPLLIFPDASSRVSTYSPNAQGSVARTGAEPLLAGDFVDLGNFAAGTKLDFFLIANGASGGNQVFSTDGSVNPDGINHVVSFAALSGSYLLIGFEDLFGGGDRDFNDVLFAVDIGARNLATLTAAHEPATVAILAAFLGVGGWIFRRRANPPGGSPSQSLRPG